MKLKVTPAAGDEMAPMTATLVGPPRIVWRSPDGVDVFCRTVTTHVKDVGLVAAFHLGVELPTPCTDIPIELRAEAPADRFFEKVGISQEAKTGDPSFDDEIFIDTEASDETVHGALGNPALREAVRALLRMTGEVTIDTNEVRVADGAQTPDPWRQHALLETLAAVPRLLGADGGSAYRPRPVLPAPIVAGRGRIRTRVVLGLVVAIGVVSFIASVWLGSLTPETLSGPAYSVGVAAGALVWFVSSVPCALLLRGRSRSPQHLAVLLATLGPLLLLGGALAETINVARDSGPATVHESTLDYTPPAPKSGSSTRVTTPWRGGGSVSVYRAPVDGPQVLRHRRSGPARVTTKPGALGSEWIVRVEVTGNPDPP